MEGMEDALERPGRGTLPGRDIMGGMVWWDLVKGVSRLRRLKVVEGCCKPGEFRGGSCWWAGVLLRKLLSSLRDVQYVVKAKVRAEQVVRFVILISVTGMRCSRRIRSRDRRRQQDY